jgi:hypothetical protein
MVGTGNDKLAEKEYQSYIVNKGLSNYPDTVLYSNEMNIHNHLDNLLQYSYLLNSIRPMKRWAKWNKKEDVNDMDIVKEYYGFSNEKAKSALSILSLDQLKEIRTKLQRGGINEPSGDISRDKTSKRR